MNGYKKKQKNVQNIFWELNENFLIKGGQKRGQFLAVGFLNFYYSKI